MMVPREPRTRAVDSITAARSRFRQRMTLYRVLRTIPENKQVPFRDAVSPTLSDFLAKAPVVAPLYRHIRSIRFHEDLRLLHDVLSESELAGHYWVWGGLLLGWAREGQVIVADVGDADFCYAGQDDHRFEQAVPLLLAAGFRRWFSFRNGAGELPVQSFIRRGSKFDFFRMTEVGDRWWEYYLYGSSDEGPVELVAHLPRQELESFFFLGRTWLKSQDHILELTTNYGDWDTPDPEWSYLDDGAVVSRRAWRPMTVSADSSQGGRAPGGAR